jgi:hypothetical protein
MAKEKRPKCGGSTCVANLKERKLRCPSPGWRYIFDDFTIDVMEMRRSEKRISVEENSDSGTKERWPAWW